MAEKVLSDAHIVTRRKRVQMPTFEENKERFAEFFDLERDEKGVVTVTMQYDGGAPVWSYEMHEACAELFTALGHDKDNEVIIITSKGDYWISKMDVGSFHAYDEPDHTNDDRYNVQIYDTMKVVENLVFDIEVPTIAAMPGGGIHWEMGMLMDVTLVSPEFLLRDNHFTMPPGHVGGDGMFMVAQELMGKKRANYFEFMGQEMTAEEAKAVGMVNEIVPRDQLLTRAHEIADFWMQFNRTCRRMQHMLAMRPWQRLLVNDFKCNVLAEMYNKALEKAPSGFDKMETYEKG